MNPIVIIGTGLAGYNLAKEIRKIDKHVPLQLITADEGESYSKPMLSNALSKGKTPSALVLSTAEQMAGQLAASVMTGTRVQSIDTADKIIFTDVGDIEYHKLVLAVGARQIDPVLNGNAPGDVLTVNNLDDYRRFRQRLESVQHIGIIGPGLIGCEFANDLVTHDKQVTVIGPSRFPLDRLLPEAIGKLLMQKLEDAGVQWRLSVLATGVDRRNTGYRIMMNDGSHLDVDLVLSAVGLRPDTALAEHAGITVNRGIVVGRTLETSASDVYALGDCIEIEGLVLPYVLPLMNAARTLAKTLTGTVTEIRYPPMPVVVKTPAHPLVVSPPAGDCEGEWNIEIDDAGARALYQCPDGSVAGFVLTGDKVSEKQKLSKQLPPVLG
ncbi:MAG: FAD-dependent oxidoreductase [Gammaproteobacteria bacterium]|jgi:rubredoxin-NAD+ reductase